MGTPSSTSRGRHDPLLAVFLADHRGGMTVSQIALKHGTYRERVARALLSRPDYRAPGRGVRSDLSEPMAKLAAHARAAMEATRIRRIDPAARFAAGVSAAIHILRGRVRAVGPICVDSPTVAAAHAAGLTLDDTHEVFAVPPAEAVRAIAAHAGR
ncbi:hypothetical protein DA075_08420 [Methylobacterium currus]|uniref:Uncharacterized protein n=1 Tax=Methylobacterium currus TaxID=2051553 RepID=A0A2R4WHB5_9HYPH|nr:hypothetical protein [Methylobacterium currus]AWB20931.1 hypothetical protein DA075_08420 [Methylobacterium currus]